MVLTSNCCAERHIHTARHFLALSDKSIVRQYDKIAQFNNPTFLLLQYVSDITDAKNNTNKRVYYFVYLIHLFFYTFDMIGKDIYKKIIKPVW